MAESASEIVADAVVARIRELAHAHGATIRDDATLGELVATLKLGESADARRRALAQAKVQLGNSMRFVGQQCIQLHGGIGMTWEYPAHLYLKRAKADELALGTPGTYRARLAELVDLPA